MFCKNKITVLIVIYSKILCKITRDTIGESVFDKLEHYIRFLCLKQICLSHKGLHHVIHLASVIFVLLYYVIFRCIQTQVIQFVVFIVYIYNTYFYNTQMYNVYICVYICVYIYVCITSRTFSERIMYVQFPFSNTHFKCHYSILNLQKHLQKQPPECSVKKVFLKISQFSQESSLFSGLQRY